MPIPIPTGYVSARWVKNVRVSGADVSFDIELGYPAKSQIDTIRQEVIAAVNRLGVGSVSANVFTRIVAHGAAGRQAAAGVRTSSPMASGQGWAKSAPPQ